MKICTYILIIASLMFLSSCSPNSIISRIAGAYKIATDAGFSSFSIETDTFNLAGFKKMKSTSDVIKVYIEGDGRAWVDRYTISNNPTPKNPVALRLAVMDKSPNVIYFGRPCQYVELRYERYCSPRIWTSQQFSESVISAYVDALDQVSNVFNPEGFHLVGFSGGGAIAVLLTAKRKDILSLRTVAGNLDHDALTKYHKATSLTGSLNPMTIASTISLVPQRHYSGSEDKIVPSWVAKSFVEATGNSKCVDYSVIMNAGHISGWVSKWKELFNYIPEC